MKNNYLPLILIATAFGLLAGAAGALFANLYATGDGSFALNRELNLSNYGYLSPSLVIRDAKKVVVNQDVKADETIRSLASSLLGVFAQAGDDSDYYKLEQPFASALVATSDGWVMAAWPEELSKGELEKIHQDFVVIDGNRKIYTIDLVVADTNTIGNFVFIHLLDASGLSVRRLVPDEEIKAGQSLLLAGANNTFLLNSLSGKNFDDVILSSDAYARTFSLAYQIPTQAFFVFNLSGEIIGAIDYRGRWLTSPELSVYWQSLLKEKALSWPSLGVHYLNLSAVAGAKDLPAKGVKLQGINNLPAVAKNSPADKAGLLAGDIINRVNGIELNSENDLAVIISSYLPGDSLLIDYTRQGNNLQTEAVLGKTE
ncbi:MAG: PDZ domain-containing protein [Patescibacteria group bacterium]|nr:PDZ domain-containing protein [Patescibacteria group bacterium]